MLLRLPRGAALKNKQLLIYEKDITCHCSSAAGYFYEL